MAVPMEFSLLSWFLLPPRKSVHWHSKDFIIGLEAVSYLKALKKNTNWIFLSILEQTVSSDLLQSERWNRFFRMVVLVYFGCFCSLLFIKKGSTKISIQYLEITQNKPMAFQGKIQENKDKEQNMITNRKKLTTKNSLRRKNWMSWICAKLQEGTVLSLVGKRFSNDPLIWNENYGMW